MFNNTVCPVCGGVLPEHVDCVDFESENAEPMDAPDYATERDIDRAESEDITYREFGGLS